MCRDVVTTNEDCSVAGAARLMADRGVGSICIVSTNGTLIGLFTERDLLTQFRRTHDPDFGALAVGEHMCDTPATGRAEMDAVVALLVMARKRIRHLPVVGPVGQIEGVVSIRDLAEVAVARESGALDSEDFLGDYLTGTGVITYAEAERAREKVSASIASDPIGKIALDRGVLTVSQVMAVLGRQADSPLRFGELAVEMGLLTDAQVDALLVAQKRPKTTLVRALLEMGALSEAQLTEELAYLERTGVPVTARCAA